MPRLILAEVTATVAEIVVHTGQSVLDGQTLMILESMKMEIPVEAPADAVVGDVLVSEGDSVQEGQPLLALHSA
jgi:acetyl-CoA carboxylase biotin carboxyl carrier protein